MLAGSQDMAFAARKTRNVAAGESQPSDQSRFDRIPGKFGGIAELEFRFDFSNDGKRPFEPRSTAEKRLLSGRCCEKSFQQVLEAAMDEAVGAQKSERSSERIGYRSGYYNRTLVRRVGELELRVPQDR